MIPFSYHPIYTSPSVSRVTLSLSLLTFSTEPGQYPDMEAILSIYLRDRSLETLPYITGYCGEFGILQRAGPRQIPGMSMSLQIFVYCYHYLSLISDMWGLFGSDNDRVRRRRRDALDREAAAYLRADSAAVQRTLQSTSPAYTRVRRPVQANAVAGPSTQPGRAETPGSAQGQDGLPGESVLSPSQLEIDLLIRLANGSGLSQYDTLGFLEKCTRCGYFFLGSFIGPHITSCTR